MPRLPLSLTLVLAACAAAERPLPQRAADAPPFTRTVAQVDTIHGVRVPDPYRWLEEEKSPEVQAWMAAQDDYARDRLRRIPGRDALAARLAQVLYVHSLGAPEHKGSRYFYPRRFATKEKAIIHVRDGRDGPERVLLDPNSWTQDSSDALRGWWPSWNGKRGAYKVRDNDSYDSSLHVIVA